MRILLSSDPELPVPPKLYGGIERIVDLLATGLQIRGHSVGLVAHPDSTSKVTQFFPWRGKRSQDRFDTIQNTIRLWSIVQEFKPDLVHSFSRILYLLPLLGSQLPKVMSYQRYPTKRTTSWGAKLAQGTLTFTGCSDYICTLGKANGGIWHTIHNCVELEKYNFVPKVAEDAPLVFLSRVERIKGAHTAIAVAHKTGRRLIIAGNYSKTGEEGKYWQEEIVPNLGKNGIEYIGTVNDAQKNELLGQAAAMIVPIEWEEPFGIVFAEALACGTPVISSSRGALPEIVRQGIDGYLVNSFEEAVTTIEKLPNINRHNCRQRVEQCFSADVIVEQYEKLYQDISR
ncbi:glycosyltransferase [Nostoc sp. 'Peltigera membranacea cyanobiont' N6]|uniref:glycosyltransferase n=1 Tax=Nostoc sp. 'Peltigera membranacea cyanobiont' N6 TaxID=1261031 RepID=UPI000CF342C2|nr:glycosyltransferase [Nostoc sp. 'Peltigera membranacea cyanobiont' N6]AVH62375.1 group 1 glucosyltransferase [Nostoc sp. 'Peltigera membranacea cyanobiont' N6]